MLKGSIQPDHIPVNKFQLLVVGQPRIRFVNIAGLEEELQTVDLPDRTKASGGNTNPVEFTATTMAHHTLEQAAIEAWYKEGQDPVQETYKKVGTLIMQSLSGGKVRTFSLVGLFVNKRVTPELDMANEGEPALIEWTFMADQMLPI
jgi:hypothetical protein